MGYFKIGLSIKNGDVCSYFVDYEHEKYNIYKFTKNVCLINPKDFESLKGFKEVYSGKFKLYGKEN